MRIGFIGLGNMGGPMAANLIKAGHTVRGYDLVPHALQAFADSGGIPTQVAREAVADAELVLTMLPMGRHVREVYTGEGGILDAIPQGAQVVDSSTIDVESARAVAAAAADRGFDILDAPVSGGVGGAATATLTFMVGGSEAAFQRALPVLQAMGRTIVHTGPSGNGQA